VVAAPRLEVGIPARGGLTTMRFDWVLAGLFLGLAVIGLVNLYSATRVGGRELFDAQLWWFAAGLAVAAVTALIDTAVFERVALVAWAAILVLLAVTLAAGTELNGARRWLNLGVVMLQPSELAKLGVVLVLARYAHERNRPDRWDVGDIARVSVIVLPACALVLLEPNLGHTVMLLAVAVTMVLFAGVQLRALALVTMVVVPAVPLLWAAGAIQPYQIGRIAAYVGLRDPAALRAAFQAVAGLAGAIGASVFVWRLGRGQRVLRALMAGAVAASLFAMVRGGLDVGRSMGWLRDAPPVASAALGVEGPAEEADDVVPPAAPGPGSAAAAAGPAADLPPLEKTGGYQALQSKIAIGSGGLGGKGLFNATQSAFGFLPYHQTDFVFPHLAEEHGFVGAALVLLLFLGLILWSLRIAGRARDRFGRFAAVGIGAILFWHVLINVGMVSGLLPVVGVTLPLFSKGGSSALTVFLCAGLLMSISLRRAR